MASSGRIRGPRLVSKLLLIGLVLLAVPWLSYVQLVEMERLLIQGQQNAQLLIARGVAALFNERDDLFNELPVQLDEYESLYALPLYQPIPIDGSIGDWDEDALKSNRRFAAQGETDASFELTLGEQVNELYGFIDIKDDIAVYRNLSELSLNTADHIRIEFTDATGQRARIALTFSTEGFGTGYRMASDWRTPIEWTPINDVIASLIRSNDGFHVEFRMPIAKMAHGRDFNLAFVDVDDSASRIQREIVSTTASSAGKKLNLVVLRSIESMDLIAGLEYVDTKIVVYDQQQRVRGESDASTTTRATESTNSTGLMSGFEFIRPLIHLLTLGETWTELSVADSRERFNRALEDALSGNPTAIRHLSDVGMPTVMAAYPIRSRNETLGAVTIESDINQILSFQQAALRHIVFVSGLTLLLVLAVTVGFSARLAYRIRRLRREAAGAIDEYGRLTRTSLESEVHAGDEIGDLARAIDGMLTRLREHSAFVERMPRTLRHEVNNPLNTLSTSLENLEQAETKAEREECINSAQRGVQRIGAIVQNLADASNLEDALRNEERESFDVQALLKSYVENLNRGRDSPLFVFSGVKEPAMVSGSDIHIEQMMDKIVDNAVDFHRPNSQIKIQLEVFDNLIRITVGNRGPTLGESAHLMFERLVSRRSSKSTSHFGLGLYIVRVIAEYHGGTVHAFNLRDQSGVLITVQLPRFRASLASAA
ncbi:MAG: ATP-binding protein [Gammaproteobacteria bacterium]|nr:ATP-binding protein [Gammaproteobacteria bacterium]